MHLNEYFHKIKRLNAIPVTITTKIIRKSDTAKLVYTMMILFRNLIIV